MVRRLYRPRRWTFLNSTTMPGPPGSEVEVPEDDLPGVAREGRERSVRREGHAPRLADAPLERIGDFPPGGVEKPHRTIVAGNGEEAAGRMVRHVGEVLRRLPVHAPGRGVPVCNPLDDELTPVAGEDDQLLAVRRHRGPRPRFGVRNLRGP